MSNLPLRNETARVGLISCPACNRTISMDAEACPQCGHPNRGKVEEKSGPTCSSCDNSATTVCERCGIPVCPNHLKPVWGHGQNRELRCPECAHKAQIWMIVAIVFFVIFALFFVATRP